MEPKAYVTQELSTLNYNTIHEYGELVFVTGRDYMSVDGTEHNQALTKHIRAAVQNFNPDIDYVVPSGSPLVTAVVLSSIAKKHNHVRILRWSNRDYRYYPFTLEV